MRINARLRTGLGLVLATVLLAGSIPTWAQKETKPMVYRPPLRGAPSSAVRVGGGTRGDEQSSFELSVLAPDHIGLTTNEQPTLYWFNSETINTLTELTVIEGDGFATLLELQLQPPLAAGVHALRLREHGVRLASHVNYQWFVAKVVDPQRRSSDIAAAGEIRRVTLPADVTAQLDGSEPSDAMVILANAGIWYDALDALSQQIERAPRDTALRDQRAALLEQIGLSGSAEFERARSQ